MQSLLMADALANGPGSPLEKADLNLYLWEQRV
jgi:hypothetical protein